MKLETRIGTLSFESGYPTDDTAQKLYDEMDFERAVQAFLWAFPAVSFESIAVSEEAQLSRLLYHWRLLQPDPVRTQLRRPGASPQDHLRGTWRGLL